MTQPLTSPEERFAAIAAALGSHPGLANGADESHARRGFGASGLKIDGKIFAMLVRGNLVVKLPKPRVDALVATGDGERYDPRRDGRQMKEWASVPSVSQAEWLSLAQEALDFVASRQ